MSFNIPEDRKEVALKNLSGYLSEYTNLSQMVSFSGTTEDRANLNEYAATILDYLFMTSFEGADKEWNWQAFQDAKNNWHGRNMSNTKEEVIEHVIYNLGSYDSSLPTGERWEYLWEEDSCLVFQPIGRMFFSISEAAELKEKFSNIEEIEVGLDPKRLDMRLYVRLYTLN